MRIVSFDSGRVTWLFPTEEFIPLGSGDGREIIKKVADRYNFAHPPENPTREEILKNGLKFASGQFSFENEISNIGEFVAYSDGLVCNANTTEPATAFLEDLFVFLKTELRFRAPISPIKKVSVSNIIIEFEGSINSLLADQQAAVGIVESYLNEAENTSFPVQLSRLDFSLDRGAPDKPSPKWTLESRANIPLSQNRFFSSAAMPTKQHLEMLGKIEIMFQRRKDSAH